MPDEPDRARPDRLCAKTSNGGGFRWTWLNYVCRFRGGLLIPFRDHTRKHLRLCLPGYQSERSAAGFCKHDRALGLQRFAAPTDRERTATVGGSEVLEPASFLRSIQIQEFGGELRQWSRQLLGLGSRRGYLLA